MEENKYNIIIIGGGVAGLSLAHSLKNSNLKILLLERKPRYIDANRGDTLYPHSLDILNKWNILEPLINKGAIKSEKFCIFNKEGDESLINITEKTTTSNKFLLSLNHELIEETLYENLKDCKNISIVQGANVTRMTETVLGYESLTYRVGGEDKVVYSSLFIGADGRDSSMRRLSEVEYKTQDFLQDIIILNSTHPFQYDNNTWLIYGKNHEILVAPLPNKKSRLSIIVKREDSMKWMKMNEEQLEDAIKKESSLFDECIITKDESHIYEIKMSLAQKFNDRNLIFIGDSAHTVHPISGQGMALAISDADLLSFLIMSKYLDLSVQNAILLGIEYSNQRREVVQKLQEIVSNLGNLLISEKRTSIILRMLILNIVLKVPFFEYEIENMVKLEAEKF